MAGALQGLAWPFYLGLAVVAALFAWQAAFARFDDPADCLAKFKANFWVGLALFAGIVAGQVAN